MQPSETPSNVVDAMFVALEHALGCRQKFVDQLAALKIAQAEILTESAGQSDEKSADVLANIEVLRDELQAELGKLDAIVVREFPNVERVFVEAYGQRLRLYLAAEAIALSANGAPAPQQPTMETIQ